MTVDLYSLRKKLDMPLPHFYFIKNFCSIKAVCVLTSESPLPPLLEMSSSSFLPPGRLPFLPPPWEASVDHVSRRGSHPQGILASPLCPSQHSVHTGFCCSHILYILSPQRHGPCPLLCASHLFSSSWICSSLVFWLLLRYFDHLGHFAILVIIVTATILVVTACQGHIRGQTLNQVFTRIPLYILTATLGSRQNY